MHCVLLFSSICVLQACLVSWKLQRSSWRGLYGLHLKKVTGFCKKEERQTLSQPMIVFQIKTDYMLNYYSAQSCCIIQRSALCCTRADYIGLSSLLWSRCAAPAGLSGVSRHVSMEAINSRVMRLLPSALPSK